MVTKLLRFKKNLIKSSQLLQELDCTANNISNFQSSYNFLNHGPQVTLTYGKLF